MQHRLFLDSVEHQVVSRGENVTLVTRTDITNFAAALAREFSPQRVVLFGSHARNDARVDSDVDLLVIMPRVTRPISLAAEMVTRLRPRFAVDLLIRTPKQIRERLAANDFFLRNVIESGETLYEAAHN